jgi:hypothetical protein
MRRLLAVLAALLVMVVLEAALSHASELDELQGLVDGLEGRIDDVAKNQADQLGGLRTMRELIARIVGTETGIIPAGTPTLIELGEGTDTGALEVRLRTLEGTLVSVRFCLRQVVSAVRYGDTFVTGCLLV